MTGVGYLASVQSCKTPNLCRGFLSGRQGCQGLFRIRVPVTIVKHVPVKIALKQNPGVERCSTFRGLEAPLQLYASEGAGSLVNHLISDALP